MSHICKIGTTDITEYVCMENFLPLGGGTKYSSAIIPRTNRYSMRHEGVDPRGWSLMLEGICDSNESNIDAVMKLFKNATEDTKFYPYHPEKFARILFADANEGRCGHGFQSIWRAEANVYATINDLFSDAATVWYPGKNESVSITPTGTVAAPLDELSIIGRYVNGSHVESPSIEIYDAAGSTLQASVLITDILLTDEELKLDYRGKITQIYSDDFTSAQKFVQDTYNVGCSIETDGLTVGKNCSATWLLSGPWPLTKNIVIETTELVNGSGKIYLLYSFDNNVWRTAVSNSDMKEQTTWTVPNTAGHGDVYIRFSETSSGDDADERTGTVILSEITQTLRNRDEYVIGVWGKTNNAGDYMLLIKLATGVYAYQILASGVSDEWHIGSDYEASVDMYAASVVTEHTDRTDAQILSDIITPTAVRLNDDFVRGVWGRTQGSYMLIVKLDNGLYAYQPFVTVNGSQAWAVGTAAEAAHTLYEYSEVGGDRSTSVILADILNSTSPQMGSNVAKGVWGRVSGSGDYMLIVRLATDIYAYMPGVAANGSLAWSVGTSAQAASIFYSYCAIPSTRTSAQILADITGTVIPRDPNVRGIWGRTYGSGGYALLVKLAADTYSCWFSDGARSIATAAQVAQALYNSTTGTRTLADITSDISNTSWPNYNDPSKYYTVYGGIANANPKAKIFQVQDSPIVRAYQITQSNGSLSAWKHDTSNGTSIRDALVSASPALQTRTLADITADIVSASFPDYSAYEYSVDGPYAGKKPTVKVTKLQASPMVYAYQIAKTDGTYSAWAIDDVGGIKAQSDLLLDVTTDRTEADILASINALVFYELSSCTYQVYGYISGARPVATVIQLRTSPQVLAYKISQSTGVDTTWVIEQHSGTDCRSALIAGFTGISSRTQDDIWNDIKNGTFVNPASISWTVRGINATSKPYADIILLANSPRIYAYQIDQADGGFSAWAIDNNGGTTISGILEQNSAQSQGGNVVIRDINITQERRIPTSYLPVIPLDGLSHIVKIVNGPDISSAYLKTTGETVGIAETFLMEDANDGNVYLIANTGKYLSSSWGENYVQCTNVTPGIGCEFRMIPLGISEDENTIGAIRCISGQYLSASNDEFVLATSNTVGPTELFEFVDLGSDMWAFKIMPSVDSDVLELDSGEFDIKTLDGQIGEVSTYANNYLSAVSGTLSGTNPVTVTYRDRYSI